MAYDVNLIANKLISMGLEKNKPFTPMQIIKLVYICHGFMLGLYHRPLIKQPVNAWRYGPVINKLYDAMRCYGGSHVTELLSAEQKELDQDESYVVEQVFNKYHHLSGIALSTLTHRPNTPWDKVWNQLKSRKGIIPNDIIEDCYSKLYQGHNVAGR